MFLVTEKFALIYTTETRKNVLYIRLFFIYMHVLYIYDCPFYVSPLYTVLPECVSLVYDVYCMALHDFFVFLTFVFVYRSQNPVWRSVVYLFVHSQMQQNSTY